MSVIEAFAFGLFLGALLLGLVIVGMEWVLARRRRK